jgi:uncharacterized protein (DUF2062 family)
MREPVTRTTSTGATGAASAAVPALSAAAGFTASCAATPAAVEPSANMVAAYKDQFLFEAIAFPIHCSVYYQIATFLCTDQEYEQTGNHHNPMMKIDDLMFF